MKAKCETLMSLVIGAGIILCTSANAPAQGLKQQIIGTWQVVSAVNDVNGQKVEPLGPHPMGYFVFTSDGHLSTNIVKPGLPKFASNNRLTGTAEENKAVVQGNISTFGTYTVDSENSITFHITGSSYPNFTGTTQKRGIEITGDQLKWSVIGASSGGSAVVTMTRAK